MKREGRRFCTALLAALALTAGLAACADSGGSSGNSETLGEVAPADSTADGGKDGADSQKEDNQKEDDSRQEEEKLAEYTPVDPDSVPENAEGDFTYEITKNDETTVTGYIGTATQVRVPATLDGKPVTAIGENAFAQNETITYVYLPDSVTELGNSAFYLCKGLLEVRLPDGVTGIPKLCFSGTSLRTVTFPERCATIGERAFSHTLLTEVEFPSALNYISKEAFYYCKYLENADFSQTALGKIVEGAFQYCGKLQSVALPASVNDIGDRAFEDCDVLSEFTIAEGGKLFVEDGLVYELVNEGRYLLLFRVPASPFVDAVIRDGTYEISFCAFSYNQNLRSVVMPDSVTRVDRRTFYYCKNLESVTLSKSLTYLSQDMFYSCESLKELSLPDGMERIISGALNDCDSLTTLVFPEGVTELGDYVLTGESLESVTIPATVKKISSSVFGLGSGISIKDIYYGGSESDWKNLYSGELPEGITMHYAN